MSKISRLIREYIRYMFCKVNIFSRENMLTQLLTLFFNSVSNRSWLWPKRRIDITCNMTGVARLFCLPNLDTKFHSGSWISEEPKFFSPLFVLFLHFWFRVRIDTNLIYLFSVFSNDKTGRKLSWRAALWPCLQYEMAEPINHQWMFTFSLRVIYFGSVTDFTAGSSNKDFLDLRWSLDKFASCIGISQICLCGSIV